MILVSLGIPTPFLYFARRGLPPKPHFLIGILLVLGLHTKIAPVLVGIGIRGIAILAHMIQNHYRRFHSIFLLGKPTHLHCAHLPTCTFPLPPLEMTSTPLEQPQPLPNCTTKVFGSLTGSSLFLLSQVGIKC